jgi:hypothetical protein
MAKIKELRRGDIFCEHHFNDRFEALSDPVFEHGFWYLGIRCLNDNNRLTPIAISREDSNRDLYHIFSRKEPLMENKENPLLVVNNEVRPLMAASIASGLVKSTNVLDHERYEIVNTSVRLADAILTKCGVAIYGPGDVQIADGASTAAESDNDPDWDASWDDLVEKLSSRRNKVPLSDLVSERDALRAVAQTFCDRVESGEVRSRRTYAAFKEILKKYVGEEETTD